MIPRPEPDEYSAYYAAYVAAAPDGDLLSVMERRVEEWRRLARAVGEERAAQPSAPGKWSMRDTIQHVVDTERVMAYRALRAARGDATPLSPFEQDDFVRVAGANDRTCDDLIGELEAVRHATIALFRPLSDEALARRGIASGAPITARALAYIIAGHELSHLRLLGERLLGTSAS